MCDAGDPDDDNDTVLDEDDLDAFNPNVCSDLDLDGCDDCSSGIFNLNQDGLIGGSDTLCDVGDPDDDNDGVADELDDDSCGNTICSDIDNDGCDD